MITNFNKIVNKNILKNKNYKNFSVFNKLKDYLKSGLQSTYSVFGSHIDPDKLKIEYEDEKAEDKETSKTKKSKETTKSGVRNKSLRGSESKLVQQLPNDLIKFERNITVIRQEEKDREVLEAMLAEIQKEDTTQHIKKTAKSKIKTMWEKLDTYEATADGKIKLPFVFEEDGKTQRIFNTMNDYILWKENRIVQLRDKIFEKLTPMEYYITQGKGTERPYTGDYWDTNKVGVYACKVCTQRVFSSTHKYTAKGIGHASFWNFLPFTLNFHEDSLDFPSPTQAVYKIQYASSKPTKRITCSNCDSHLGHVFEDGPAPFFKRLNINSVAIHFLDIGWFTSPDEIKRQKELSILVQEQERIEKENTVIERMKADYPHLFDYINKNIAEQEKSITHDKIVETLNMQSSLNPQNTQENKNI